MAYDYSSENQRLELPNPYRVENTFLFICALALVAAGLAALLWSRSAIQSNLWQMALVPLVVGVGLLSSGLAFAVAAARRLRFFFGRGRPLSLAPEIAIGATGNSEKADECKTILRHGGLQYPEPVGALNGVLYHLFPRLITAPLVVQHYAQKHFFNALAFLSTFISFVFAWGLFANEPTRPLISLIYFLFAAAMLLKPIYTGQQARMTTTSFILLIVVAIIGPVLTSLFASSLPSVNFTVHSQTFFLLLTALLAVILILLAVFAQVSEQPQTERSCEQVSLSMNGPPGSLLTELERTLQNEWVEKIPNRRYTRLEPVTHAAAGSGQFAGELFEETQPMPLTGTTPPTFGGALATKIHRWLFVLDMYATLLVLASVTFALSYVHQYDVATNLNQGGISHTLMGYSLICLIVAGFCFQSTSAIWGRFNFESVLIWVEVLGVWQSSRIGTGNQLASRMQSENEVVRVESMTLRVWRARIESVVFGKDSPRQITAMFGTHQAAKQLASDLCQFATQQSVFIAPQASEDRRRLAAMQGAEQVLHDSSNASAGLLGAGELHDTLRVATAHNTKFCTACGASVVVTAKFCGECGQAMQAVKS